MKAKTMTCNLHKQEAINRTHAIDFFSNYATTLLSSGATSLRTETNIGRMAEFYNIKVIITIMPKHVQIMLTMGDESVVRVVSRTMGINFYSITELSRLSWRVVEERLDVATANKILEEIKSKKRCHIAIVTIMAGLANASFCRLFGGDYWAMFFVLIATISGFYTKHELVNKIGIDARIATIFAASISSVLSCGASMYGLGNTPEVSLATSVLYLVPGIPYINAFSDLINGHHICALSWLISALETTICLGTGLVLGNYLLNL